MACSAACSLITPLDELAAGTASGAAATGAGGGATAASGAGSGTTAGTAAASGATTGAGTGAGAGTSLSPIVSGLDGVAAATGNAQQQHVVFAEGSGRWWLFYVDGAHPSELRTRSSSDFVTWTDGASLALPHPHAGEGRSFSADAAFIGGVDVVHLSTGHRLAATDRRRLHARATLSDDGVSFEEPVEINAVTEDHDGLDPDGAVTAITATNRVVDLSGWTVNLGGSGVGNSQAWWSAGPDQGSAGPQAWDGQQDLETVTTFVNARALAALPDGDVLALWERGDEDTPTNVRWSRGDGSGWSSPASVFASAAQDPNDWAVCVVGPAVHAVRRTIAGAYEHRLFDGADWSDGDAIPAGDGKVGTGVVLATDLGDVWLFAIADDAGNTVRGARWIAGAGWGEWFDVQTAPALRSWLSGSPGAGGGGLALVWTEEEGGASTIAGARLAVP